MTAQEQCPFKIAAPLRFVITRKSINLFWVMKKQEKGGIKVRTYSLWFIQINSLQYTNNKSNKNRETSDQKISNQ